MKYSKDYEEWFCHERWSFAQCDTAQLGFFSRLIERVSVAIESHIVTLMRQRRVCVRSEVGSTFQVCSGSGQAAFLRSEAPRVSSP